jgi:hypothetical protein
MSLNGCNLLVFVVETVFSVRHELNLEILFK